MQIINFIIIIIIFITIINKDIYEYNYTIKYKNGFKDKIIHQTWKHNNLDTKQKKFINSWKNNFPNWEYKYWTDDLLDEYVIKEFNEVYNMWVNLNPFIKKIDCIRYMWLYTYGGIYSDLDIKCLKNFEHLLQYPNAAYIPVNDFRMNWKKNTDNASPALIISCSNHPFWLLCIRYICSYHHMKVKIATGPIALTNVILICYNYKKKLPFDLIFLKENKFGIGWKKFLKKYTYHINTNSWDDQTTKQKFKYDKNAITWLDNKIKKKCGKDFYNYYLSNLYLY